VQHSGGKILAGFLISGFLFALLGAVLPAWGFHRDPPEFIEAGHYFLSLAIGVISSSLYWSPLLGRRGIPFRLVFGCGLTCGALAYLAAVGPPSAAMWRIFGLFVLGVGAGLLNEALFHAITPQYQRDPAGTVTHAGILYGMGCLSATLLVAGTFYAYTVPSILLFMAAVPGVCAPMYAKIRIDDSAQGEHPTLRQAFEDFKSPGAVLFALLLFFQFGNEWSIAGWLPIFLIRRVGLSPIAALWVLATYWFFLLAGRLAAIVILPRVRHGRLLGLSVLSALFGCLLLYSTTILSGALAGVVFVGSGYACIYPLVAERIGRRFPYYHPGFFNGIFTFAQVGGLLAPATLGYCAEPFGIGVVMAIPLLGTGMVVALLFLIWLESKVTGR
jgi:fucose permease